MRHSRGLFIISNPLDSSKRFTLVSLADLFQSCQVELSVMREISLLQYVKRGRNIGKTRSALPEVAKHPRMLRGPGPPGILFN